MTPVPATQMTLSFEPSLADRFPSLRHYVAHRAAITQKAMKVQAADMDMAPSMLSRKLNPGDGDTQRFNVDDLEAWLVSTGETSAVIEYLAAKYMDTPAARKARLLAKLEGAVPEMLQMLSLLKDAA
jgi:hypothetical protein